MDGCREQRIFNSYAFDVPLPDSGDVTIKPGNQPPAVIDAAKAIQSGVVTVFYGRQGEGRYVVTVTEYDKSPEVKKAR